LSLGEQRLVLIPAAVALDTKTAAQWTTRLLRNGKELRIPCVLHTQDTNADSPCSRLVNEAPALQLSPLNLYTEESMIVLISAWLWQFRIEGYGEIFSRLPQAVLAEWQLDNSATRTLLREIKGEKWQILQDVMDHHIKDNVLRERIAKRNKQSGNMEHCPTCDQTAKLFNPDASNKGFYARCNCGCEWKLRDGRFQVSRNDFANPGFETLGRHWLDVEIM